MNNIVYHVNRRRIEQFILRVLIILSILLSISPQNTNPVHAQNPNGGVKVYLPLIYKNPVPTCPDGPDQWLCHYNLYRTIVGVNPVAQNVNYNYGLDLHTAYLVACPQQVNVSAHTETECPNLATPTGDDAGRTSNMAYLLGGMGLTVKGSIDLWMATPNHRYNMLNPYLLESGFSHTCELNNCFSGLNVLKSLNFSSKISINNFQYPADKQQNITPIKFPITWGFYLPLTTGLNDNDEVRYVSATIFDENNGKPGFSVNQPNRSDGSYFYFNQVVITPNNDLLPNHTYRVEMTVNFRGTNYSKSWSFTTAP